MGEDEEERRAAMRKFYQTYWPLQKSYGLRSCMHFDVCGNNRIEVWEYVGEKRGRRMVYAKEETEAACYRRAAEELKYYAGGQGSRAKGQKAG